MFPGAGDTESFWQNLLHKVDAIQPVPVGRLDPVFFDEAAKDVDRIYCRRGGFIDEYAEFDPGPFGILPLAVEGTEPEHLLTLKLAHQALTDAGLSDKDPRNRSGNCDRAGIIIGKGNYAGPGAIRAIEIVQTGQQLVELLQHIAPDIKGVEVDKIKKEFQQKKGRFAADTAMGLIPNLVASLVANRLNLGGPAYTVDAACASSLIAVDHAVKELISGEADWMIAGGVHVCQNAPFWTIFSQLGALSRSQQIRPFDRRADGLLIGEGCGFVVLKRLPEAIWDGNRIYAVIKGVGVSSDGAGASLMSPSVKGQVKAIRRAWEHAGLEVGGLGYLEAHGTGTPLGDRTEMETLTNVFGKENGHPPIGIGSVKSNIGHAMPAAGIAGLIKTALSLYHGQIPPTLHCEEPLEGMQESRFVPVSEVLEWNQTGLPMRAGVNAFGFGGINAHVILEHAEGVHHTSDRSHPRRGLYVVRGGSPEVVSRKILQTDVRDKVLLLAREDKESLLEALDICAAGGEAELPGKGPWRIALFDPRPERIQQCKKIVQRGRPWRNRQDIWFSNELLAEGGKVAYLFPGLDGLSGGEIGTVSDWFGLEVEERGHAGAMSTGAEGVASEEGVLSAALKLLEKSRVLDMALKQLGVVPDLNAGHSVGEWLAGRSAGLAEEKGVLQLVETLKPETFELEGTAFLAVGCGYAQLKPLLASTKEIYLSNDNCPQQVILCGKNEAINGFMEVLRREQIFHQLLPFRSGFHSPFLREKAAAWEEDMKKIRFRKPRIPLWSATTLELYPEDPEAIRRLSVEHLLEPVRFRELVERLYQQEGVRIFIQVGSGGLTGFIDDTLKGHSYSAVAANTPLRPGLAQLQRVLAAVFAEGGEVDLSFLGVSAEKKRSAAVQKLQLGTPLVKELPSLQGVWGALGWRELGKRESGRPGLTEAERAGRTGVGEAEKMGEARVAVMRMGERSSGGEGESPVMRAFRDVCAEMADVQEEMMELFNRRAADQVLYEDRRQPGRDEGRQSPGIDEDRRPSGRQENHEPFQKELTISLESHSYLLDHALVRQRPGWRIAKDMSPVIPMTMMLELLGEVAEERAGGARVQQMVNIQVYQWMNVAEPFREVVKGEWKGAESILLSLEKYAQAEMIFSRRETVEGEWSTGTPVGRTIGRQQIYEQIMFHGPAYQGILEVLEFGDRGMKGLICGGAGKGSLLDNAGQLFGLWLHLSLPVNMIAFPVKIKEIVYMGDRRDQEGVFECTCVLTGLTEEFAVGDLILRKEGRVWCVIRGWQNRRLEIDHQFWKASIDPLRNYLAREIYPGVFFFHNAYTRVVSWDFVCQRYFSQEEKELLAGMAPKRKKEWIISRVAVKDAVRALLYREMGAAYYPIEFRIEKDERGKPVLAGDPAGQVELSLAHKDMEAVGIARAGRRVGIDMERIEDRGDDFYTQVFHPEELALLGDRERAEWTTRYWVAKEAYGKYLGRGLGGDPGAYRIESIEGEIIGIGDLTIQTIRHQNYIIGWTL